MKCCFSAGIRGSQRQGSAAIGRRMVMEGDDERRRKVWQERGIDGYMHTDTGIEAGDCRSGCRP
jgi:hypothetical protein